MAENQGYMYKLFYIENSYVIVYFKYENDDKGLLVMNLKDEK